MHSPAGTASVVMGSVLALAPERTNECASPETRGKTQLSIHYRDPSHEALPHFVSFSGGRSSAALTFMLAEAGVLRPSRGDAVLFANTSAEHPGTYEFAARCKERIESEFGIPFFWFEFCTVEDAWRSEYRRRASYRLVKPVPVEDDPGGFRSSGEVFEEMLALQGMLPNPHSRTCTAKLKLYPSHELLSEWIAETPGPAHAGHHWGINLVDVGEAVATHARMGGRTPPDQILMRAEHLDQKPSSRPAQHWKEFTSAPVPAGKPGPPAPMRGPNGALHIRLLGLRADESPRVDRVLSRTLFAEGATSAKCTVRTQPPGERPYFPLHDAGLDTDSVIDFWKSQSFDLSVPAGAGNCVYCFMKGTRILGAIASSEDPQRRSCTPTDIGWWADIENRYARVTPARDGSGNSRFGFFGVNALSYTEVSISGISRKGRYATGTPACDCTD